MPAVLTPLDRQLRPNVGLWIDHCQSLIDEGCHGLAILGTTSEANSLSVTERLQLLDAIGESNIEGAQLVPGTGCCAIPDTIELTRRAFELGSAAVLMLPPFYYKPATIEGLTAAYSAVIEEVNEPTLKVLLYHIPQNTGVPITLELIAALLERFPDNIVGIKDSSGDFDNIKQICTTFPQLSVFSGSDSLLLETLRIGGAGSITACNNICAPTSIDVYNNQNSDLADKKQTKLTNIRSTIQQFPLVETLKEIKARRTEDSGWRRVRPPLLPLSNITNNDLTQALHAIDFQ